MKYLLSLLAVVVISSAFTFTSNPEPQGEIKVKWMSWEEAVQANKKNPKKIFIDVYTDWCGWCKKMDKTTLSNPKIVKELNANFYSVKFDAEQKESINFDIAWFQSRYDKVGPDGDGKDYINCPMNASYVSRSIGQLI